MWTCDAYKFLLKELKHLGAIKWHNNATSFYIKFKEVFPGFEDKILSINTSLKPLDLEICAFIKLNFTTKQIATIKNISVRAVEGRKYRIRKALSISQDDNMYVWMSKI